MIRRFFRWLFRLPAQALARYPDLSNLDWHYDDCELGGENFILGQTGCWCEHRGPTSHYGGGLKPGWHRESCPNTGKPWEVTWDHDEWWQRPPCECRHMDTGIFVLTLQDGTVHGPAPGPKPSGFDK